LTAYSTDPLTIFISFSQFYILIFPPSLFFF
jgi:hypothetical protein